MVCNVASRQLTQRYYNPRQTETNERKKTTELHEAVRKKREKKNTHTKYVRTSERSTLRLLILTNPQ